EPENTAPAIDSAPAETATQGSAYSYSIQATDADDGDTLTIDAPTLPAWLSLTDNGDGTAPLSGTPAAAHVGAHDIVVRVTDAAGAAAEQAFTVTVAGTQPAPSNPSPPVQRSSGGSGSAGWLELLGIAFAAALMRRRRRGPEA